MPEDGFEERALEIAVELEDDAFAHSVGRGRTVGAVGRSARLGRHGSDGRHGRASAQTGASRPWVTLIPTSDSQGKMKFYKPNSAFESP